ncbi:hypothetical protein [Massilia sp. BSC265]|uniref:hypothetical protein n=1 Tax=Massilia sp. BSC265 TaxID=1549812 RepID=UPI0004E97A71|nr:hypothetical protein [Massilia sp. BSC265]KFI05703.1 hypothetical protein JN27_19775 [Massilia sp. BSC265]
MRTLSAIAFGTLLLCGSAAAAEEKPVRELEPVHVNAMRNPEVRKYKVILAGLDAFDRHRQLAPAAEGLHFRLRTQGRDDSPQPLAIRLVGDRGFSLPITIDADRRFVVPRSEAAEEAESELELNRKRRTYRTDPDIRTPGLRANQRRLGDLRLECKVTVAMAKEEIPTFWVLTINTLLLRTDWCGFFGDPEDFRWEGVSKKAHFPFRSDQPLLGAVMVDGSRSAKLEVKGTTFHAPIGNATWSDDAVIELTFAAPANPAEAAAAPTGTAGETPRTAP